MATKATGAGAIIGIAAGGSNGVGQVEMVVSTSFFGGDTESYDALRDQIDGLRSQINQTSAIDLSDLHVGTFTADLNTLLNGSLLVNGQAEFTSAAIFGGLVTFAKPVIFNDDITFNGNVSFNSNTGGYAVISKNAQTVHVSFSKPYAQAPIVSLSLGGGKFAQYSYNNVTADGFDIVLASPATEDLQFTWTAISVNNPNTFVQQ
jgi:hypothetical protein